MLLLILVSATFVSYPIGLAIGVPWLLPLFNSAPAYTIMIHCLRRGERRRAIWLMLVWALALILAGTVFCAVWPSADQMVLRGPIYRDEMFHWIRTGEGSEGSPRLFLPEHLLHLALFVALGFATASAASICAGAVLMNFMAFYVASLWRAGVPSGAVVLLGWQPWALCRIAAFCILGVVLAEPLLSRVRRYDYGGLGSARRWLILSALLILCDWILKAALAPAWGLGLRSYLR